MNEEFIPPSIQPEVPEPKKELTPEEKKENRNPLFLGILVVVNIIKLALCIFRSQLSHKKNRNLK